MDVASRREVCLLKSVEVWLWFIAEGSRRVFCCACASKFCSTRSAPLWDFQRASTGFQLGDRHFFIILFGEGWKKMTSIPIFLTLWILVVFAGPSDEDILMIKVRTKHEKSPKTWSLRFDLLKIKMCRWDSKPWSHIRHKALKNHPASGLSCSYNNLRRIRFWQV